MMQRAVSDAQITCNLCLRFVAGLYQLDRFLFKFSRKGSLLLLHDPFPFCGEPTLSSLLPPLLWVKTKERSHLMGNSWHNMPLASLSKEFGKFRSGKILKLVAVESKVN